MNQRCHRTVELQHRVKWMYSHVNSPAYLWLQSPRNGSVFLALSPAAVLSEINSAQQWRQRTGRLSNVHPEASAHLDLQSFNSLSVQLLSLLHFTPQISFSFIHFVLSDKNKRTLFQKGLIPSLAFNNAWEKTRLDKHLLWYSRTSLFALLYLISRLSVWLWASASRWLTTLHNVWASCQYLK